MDSSNNSIIKEKDIVPISYFPGTGGNFLADLITHAKSPYKSILRFSNYGNSHNNTHCREISNLDEDIIYSSVKKINFLLKKHIIGKGLRPPFYPAVHIPEGELLSNYFEKYIKIVYDSDDYKDLTLSFFGKYFLDHLGKTEILSDMPEMTGCITHTIGRLYYFNKDFNINENYKGVLCVSWKDLYKNSIDNLVTKLSQFTNIPEDQFTKEFIVEWRNRTKFGLDEVNRLLIENNFPGTFFRGI